MVLTKWIDVEARRRRNRSDDLSRRAISERVCLIREIDWQCVRYAGGHKVWVHFIGGAKKNVICSLGCLKCSFRKRHKQFHRLKKESLFSYKQNIFIFVIWKKFNLNDEWNLALNYQIDWTTFMLSKKMHPSVHNYSNDFIFIFSRQKYYYISSSYILASNLLSL